MDIISYGVAGKAAKSEKVTRNNILGSGVEGTSPHIKDRIDVLENALQGVVSQADKLIVNDAVNIMKAHAKLNSVAKTMKYKMQNMIFDDLLDLSGIDTTKSSGYTHDAVNGLINGGTIVTKAEVADTIPSKMILTVDEYSPSYTANVIPAMTSDTAPSGIASASKLISGTNPYLSFDGKINTYWYIDGLPTAGWLAYDFMSPKTITKYSIYPSNNSAAAGQESPKNFTFEGWNGTSWEVLDTRTNITGWTNNVSKEFTCNNTKAFSKYRLNVTSVQSGQYLTISELQMMESVSSGIRGVYFISRDSGVTWEPITPDTLFYFTDSISPQTKNLCLKAALPNGTQLLNYALTWA